jgi:cell wall-associated NlpC family hydrolase
VTTDDLPTGLPAASRALQPGVTRSLFCAAALCLASLTAQAQTTPTTTAASLEETPASASDAKPADAAPDAVASAEKPTASATSTVRAKAADAAAATLTALLPRLAANDTMPLLDRSAMFAGDLSRLLANYDLTQTGVLAQQQSGGKIQTVLQRALTLLGTPYRWGGTSPDSGFDCSGLVGYVFRTALGIELPRVSRDMATQADAELIKDRSELKQGDLVFFGRKGRVNHVGIYVGEGRFLHSPSTGKDVRVDSLLTGYWSNKFLQARRVAM